MKDWIFIALLLVTVFAIVTISTLFGVSIGKSMGKNEANVDVVQIISVMHLEESDVRRGYRHYRMRIAVPPEITTLNSCMKQREMIGRTDDISTFFVVECITPRSHSDVGRLLIQEQERYEQTAEYQFSQNAIASYQEWRENNDR